MLTTLSVHLYQLSYVTGKLYPISQEVDSEVVELQLTEVSDSPNTKSSSVGKQIDATAMLIDEMKQTTSEEFTKWIWRERA